MTDKHSVKMCIRDSIIQWLNGTKTPTFKQIEDFSKKANIPLGYFFLQTPPVAVSYTHLDVYKRQIQLCAGEQRTRRGGAQKRDIRIPCRPRDTDASAQTVK